MARVIAGAAAADFTLDSADGERFRLSDLLARSAVVLILNRGFLCPFCKRHMIRLRRAYPEFVRRGAEILVIAPERPEDFRRHWVHLKLPFPGLPDPARIVLDRYGQSASLLSLGRLPAQFVIARSGEVLFARYGRTMADIAPNRDLLEALDRSATG
ncbi:MAG: redoxin domain-containing protein [Candidatus Eisenbacteria bacterium]|nr:redoxin domain-containing protein [Candidatus Eisenbacteria bacterium]